MGSKWSRSFSNPADVIFMGVGGLEFHCLQVSDRCARHSDADASAAPPKVFSLFGRILARILDIGLVLRNACLKSQEVMKP